MIKTKFGETELNGTVAELMADYSVITDGLFKKVLIKKLGMNEDEAKDELKHAYDRGLNGVDGNSIIVMLKELIKLIEDGKADADIRMEEREGEE